MLGKKVLAEVGALASLYSAWPATLQSLSEWLFKRVTLPGRFLLLRKAHSSMFYDGFRCCCACRVFLCMFPGQA